MAAPWRIPKTSTLISLSVTLLGVGLYVHTYLLEAGGPVAQFVESIELKSYDARFRRRGETPPSPHIVMVGIDQATLERLGSWPFSRAHYVRLLDRLAGDGAAVIAFDINFAKADEKSGLEAVRRARQEYLAGTPAARRSAAYLSRLDEIERKADTDAQLAEAFRRAERVVLGYFFFPSRKEAKVFDAQAQQQADSLLAFSSYTTRGAADAQGAPPPLAQVFSGEEGYLAETNLGLFTEAVDFSVGYFNFFADADGVFRRTPLVMAYGGAWRGPKAGEANFYPSLDVQILRRYLKVAEHETVLVYNRNGVEAVELGRLRIPTDIAGRLLIHYQGGPFTYPQVSLADVVEGRVAAGTFRDKIVLVGPTALAIGDFGPTPFAESNHSGVEIHANVLDTILSQRFIHRGLREELIDLALILLFGLGLGWALAAVPPSWTAPVAAGALALFLVATYGALAWFQTWLNLVVPGMVLLGNFGGVTAYRLLFEAREKRKVRAAFQQYVPPALIQELLKEPEKLQLGGEERELTILFSDIRGFTTMSEALSPLELTRFLNAYTDEMTDIIFEHWGTLDKYEGDAIMAFWGAPIEQDDHPLRACAAALAMSRRVDELRAAWREEGRPDINIGLGMNTGRVVVGNMGSRKRFNYTVLGDPVNLASRLEGVNKEYATRILVSEWTYRAASEPLAVLEARLCREFRLDPRELAAADGPERVHPERVHRERARRARSVALYLGHHQRLAPPEALRERYGADGGVAPAQTLAEVEQWQARDKKLQRFIAEARRSLRRFVFRELDWIRVKGKREPVAIYELLGTAEEENRYARLVETYARGLLAYRRQEWRAALEEFESISRDFPEDGPARLFAARCRQFQSEPPCADWDGVYEMKTK